MSCRLCLKNNTNLVQNIISSELKCSELTLIESLYWIFGVDVDVNDPYSKFICMPCEKVIQYVGSYRTLYRRNQLILQEKLDHELGDECLEWDFDENDTSNITIKRKSQEENLSPSAKRRKLMFVDYYYNLPTTAIRDLIKGNKWSNTAHLENDEGSLFQINEEVEVEVCKYCSQIFSTRRNLELHYNTEHKSLQVKNLQQLKKSKRKRRWGKKFGWKKKRYPKKPESENSGNKPNAKYPLLNSILNPPIFESRTKKFLFDLENFPNLNFMKQLDELKTQSSKRRSSRINGEKKDPQTFDNESTSQCTREKTKFTTWNEQNLTKCIRDRYKHLLLKDFSICLEKCDVPTELCGNSKTLKRKDNINTQPVQKEHAVRHRNVGETEGESNKMQEWKESLSEKLLKIRNLNYVVENVPNDLVEDEIHIKVEPEDYYEIAEEDRISTSDDDTEREEIERNIEAPTIRVGNSISNKDVTKNIQIVCPRVNIGDLSRSVRRTRQSVLVEQESQRQENISTTISRIQNIKELLGNGQNRSNIDEPKSKTTKNRSNRNHSVRRHTVKVSSQENKKKNYEKNNENQMHKSNSRKRNGTEENVRQKESYKRNDNMRKISNIQDVVVSLARIDPILIKMGYGILTSCYSKDVTRKQQQPDHRKGTKGSQKAKRKTIVVQDDMPRVKREVRNTRRKTFAVPSDMPCLKIEDDLDERDLLGNGNVADEPPELEPQVNRHHFLRKRNSKGRVMKEIDILANYNIPNIIKRCKSVEPTSYCIQQRESNTPCRSKSLRNSSKKPNKRQEKKAKAKQKKLVGELSNLLNSMKIIEGDRNLNVSEELQSTSWVNRNLMPKLQIANNECEERNRKEETIRNYEMNNSNSGLNVSFQENVPNRNSLRQNVETCEELQFIDMPILQIENNEFIEDCEKLKAVRIDKDRNKNNHTNEKNKCRPNSTPHQKTSIVRNYLCQRVNTERQLNISEDEQSTSRVGRNIHMPKLHMADEFMNNEDYKCGLNDSEQETLHFGRNRHSQRADSEEQSTPGASTNRDLGTSLVRNFLCQRMDTDKQLNISEEEQSTPRVGRNIDMPKLHMAEEFINNEEYKCGLNDSEQETLNFGRNLHNQRADPEKQSTPGTSTNRDLGTSLVRNFLCQRMNTDKLLNISKEEQSTPRVSRNIDMPKLHVANEFINNEEYKCGLNVSVQETPHIGRNLHNQRADPEEQMNASENLQSTPPQLHIENNDFIEKWEKEKIIRSNEICDINEKNKSGTNYTSRQETSAARNFLCHSVDTKRQLKVCGEQQSTSRVNRKIDMPKLHIADEFINNEEYKYGINASDPETSPTGRNLHCQITDSEEKLNASEKLWSIPQVNTKLYKSKVKPTFRVGSNIKMPTLLIENECIEESERDKVSDKINCSTERYNNGLSDSGPETVIVKNFYCQRRNSERKLNNSDELPSTSKFNTNRYISKLQITNDKFQESKRSERRNVIRNSTIGNKIESKGGLSIFYQTNSNNLKPSLPNKNYGTKYISMNNDLTRRIANTERKSIVSEELQSIFQGSSELGKTNPHTENKRLVEDSEMKNVNRNNEINRINQNQWWVNATKQKPSSKNFHSNEKDAVIEVKNENGFTTSNQEETQKADTEGKFKVSEELRLSSQISNNPDMAKLHIADTECVEEVKVAQNNKCESNSTVEENLSSRKNIFNKDSDTVRKKNISVISDITIKPTKPIKNVVSDEIH